MTLVFLLSLALFAMSKQNFAHARSAPGRALPILSENFMAEALRKINPDIKWDETRHLGSMSGVEATCDNIRQEVSDLPNVTSEGQSVSAVYDFAEGPDVDDKAVQNYIKVIVDRWLGSGEYNILIKSADIFGCSVRPGCPRPYVANGIVTVFVCLFRLPIGKPLSSMTPKPISALENTSKETSDYPLQTQNATEGMLNDQPWPRYDPWYAARSNSIADDCVANDKNCCCSNTRCCSCNCCCNKENCREKCPICPSPPTPPPCPAITTCKTCTTVICKTTCSPTKCETNCTPEPGTTSTTCVADPNPPENAQAFTTRQYRLVEQATRNRWDRSISLESYAVQELKCAMLETSRWDFSHAINAIAAREGRRVMGLKAEAMNYGDTDKAVEVALRNFRMIRTGTLVGCGLISNCVRRTSSQPWVVVACIYEA